MPEFDPNQTIRIGMTMLNDHTGETETLSYQHAQMAMMVADDEEYDRITEFAQIMEYLGLYPCVRLALKRDRDGDTTMEYQLGVWNGEVKEND